MMNMKHDNREGEDVREGRGQQRGKLMMERKHKDVEVRQRWSGKTMTVEVT